MKRIFKEIIDSPVRYSLLFFLFANLFFQLPGATNATSRFVALVSLVEDHSFSIDRYYQNTFDWARTPDGHYYSNKAPGPVLFGLPLFWCLDRLFTSNIQDRLKRDEFRFKFKGFYLSILSFFLQVVPFLILTHFVISKLKAIGVHSSFLPYIALSSLFGNTASLFMNSYFGHGMASVCVISLFLAFLCQRYFWAGIFLGCGILCDYGVSLMLPVVLFGFMAIPKSKIKKILPFILGLSPPLILFGFYHLVCFGSPISLPNKFQNPVFVSQVDQFRIWGLFSFIPRFDVLWELIIGQTRGILWTQPWLLLTFCYFPFIYQSLSREWRILGSLIMISFLLALWMNGSFNAWHGGHSPGPRYMSFIFPAFSFLLGLLSLHFTPMLTRIFKCAVLVSVLFSLLVFSSFRFAEPTEIWPFYLEIVFDKPSMTTFIRLAILLPALFLTLKCEGMLGLNPSKIHSSRFGWPKVPEKISS